MSISSSGGWLGRIERVGNRLPSPAMLFILLIGVVMLASLAAALAGWQATLPDGQNYQARSLISSEGIYWLLTHMVENFIGFAPVGTVLVTMLGLGVAEHSGLLRTLLLRLVRFLSGRALGAAVVLAGILSNIAFDVGYVLLIPLAGFLFQVAGRPPLAGIAAAFAGVSAGYSANWVLGPVDVILAGITQESVAVVAPEYQVSVAGNYYFTAASTLVLCLLGTWVTERWVEPYLTDATGTEVVEAPPPETEGERRGLWWVSGWTLVFAVLVVGAASLPAAPLRHADGSLALDALVPLIAIYATVAGMLFGRASGRYQRASEALAGMEQAMGSLATYLVLIFFAAQFVAGFGWSNLGTLLAYTGAELLSGWQDHPVLLLVLFVFVSALSNLFMGSASAKWAVLGPVFVPMLYLLGIAPEAAQMAYRIGDSTTNIITPLMPYFGVVVAFAARYKKDLGIGTLASMMLPYSLVFLAGWSLMFALWLLLGWPLGPGV